MKLLDYNYPCISNASDLMTVFKDEFPTWTEEDYERIIEEHELYMNENMP